MVCSPGISDQDWGEEGGAGDRSLGRLFAVEVNVNRKRQSWASHREVLDDREGSAQGILVSKKVISANSFLQEERVMTGVRGREGRAAEEQE